MAKSDMTINKILDKTEIPLSVPEILQALALQNIKPNKTTIYRQIDTLLKNGEVIEIDLGEGKKRYEKKSQGHHHHLVCQSCHNIEHVDLAGIENNLTKLEKDLTHKKKFKVTSHALELFGLCWRCQ